MITAWYLYVEGVKWPSECFLEDSKTAGKNQRPDIEIEIQYDLI